MQKCKHADALQLDMRVHFTWLRSASLDDLEYPDETNFMHFREAPIKI